jgi:hypothetical protein
MRLATTLILVLTLSAGAVLATACGGGGGTVSDPGPSPGNQRSGEMLEDCLPAALDEVQAFAGRMQAMLQGQGTASGLSLVPGGVEATPDSLVLHYQYDANGDQVPEATGEVRFLDDTEMPIQPFTQQQLDDLDTNGIDELGALVQTLPDGTILRMSWDQPPPGLLSAQVDVPFSAGAPGGGPGVTSYADASCSVNVQWSSIALADIATPYPSGSFDLSISENPDTLDGTLTTDGTKDATLGVSRNGGANENWAFDLSTGIASQP